jgi:hypothetical protein
MRQFNIFLFGLIFSANCHAQHTLFALHPLVGDTIDKTEKMNYFLFPSIKNDNFKYCYIIQSNDHFFVNSYTLSDSINIRQIDTTEIRQYIVNIDKFHAFYLNRAKNDSLKKNKKLDLNFKDPISNYNNGQLVGEQSRERIMKEVNRDNRMKSDVERANQTKQGSDLFGGGAHFQTYRTGHKKKK